MKQNERSYLTSSEFRTVYMTNFKEQRLQTVKDIFVFCCLNGVSIPEARQMTLLSIIGTDENKLIRVPHTGSGPIVLRDLDLISISIIDKYRNGGICKTYGLLLPVISNALMVQSYREILTLCKIDIRVNINTTKRTYFESIDKILAMIEDVANNRLVN